MNFGQRLQNERIKNQLTQDEVANKLSVSRQTISSWENERTYPDINSLISLSDFYNISLDTLLKEDSGMKEYLEKNEIAKNLKPILKILIFIDVLFLITMVLREFKIFDSSLLHFFIFIMGIANMYALIRLSNLMKNIEKQKVSKLLNLINKYRSFAIIISILIIFVGIIVAYYNMNIGGLISGLGTGVIIMLFLKNKKIIK
ncbi:helix-turn-helix domain-containing protein [Apilactobacillus xinyiensis]|uniref:helix-turn-helix domain-containing protein n=1 Tax=Apilactobacillus xinyiensis TaxID=2841032 RepID=UPI001C7DE26D|nr:helix-turn-helix transcriptional regulator [Apilactobacillus xinyiensis]